MSKEKKPVYPDSRKNFFHQRTITRTDLVTRDLCQFREEIAKQLRTILQDLFNRYGELQGNENREKRMEIYRDIKDHAKLYKDLVAALEIALEKNEIRKADRSADRLLTDRGYLALPGCFEIFIRALGRIIAKFSIPMDEEMKREFRGDITQAFDDSFQLFLLNLMVEDAEREDLNQVALESKSQNGEVIQMPLV